MFPTTLLELECRLRDLDRAVTATQRRPRLLPLAAIAVGLLVLVT